MNAPVAAALLGLAVSLWFGVSALRQLRRDTPGHSHNAAMIHIAMISMFVPFCLIVLVAYWNR
jgi:heme/copper-type cytochrome/quinol oxidase subunit 2